MARDVCEVRPWLTRIATNAALMKLRKNRTAREVPVKDPAEAPDFRIEDALADSLQGFARTHPGPQQAVKKLA